MGQAACREEQTFADCCHYRESPVTLCTVQKTLSARVVTSQSRSSPDASPRATSESSGTGRRGPTASICGNRIYTLSAGTSPPTIPISRSIHPFLFTRNGNHSRVMPIPAARTTIRALSSHAALPFRRALLQDEIRGMAGGPIELPAEPPSMNTDYRFGAEAARAGTQKPRNYTTVSSPAYRPPPPQYSDVPTSEQHPCPAAYTPPARVFTPSGTHTSPSSALPAYASTYTPPAPPTYAPPVPPVPPTAAPARVDLALHADVAALKTTMAALLAAPRRAETPECVRRLQTKLDVLEARLAARTPRTALPTYAPEPPRPPPTPAPRMSWCRPANWPPSARCPPASPTN